MSVINVSPYSRPSVVPASKEDTAYTCLNRTIKLDLASYFEVKAVRNRFRK